MSKKGLLRVSEIFYSLQGEGLYTGTPSLFMRTFGCNFTCSGFGMPKGELSKERELVDPSKYKTYDDLPLVHTGCDSYPSWDIRFKHLSPMLDVKAIVDRMQELLPDGKFGNVHLVITGGEPLLGWQKQYPALLKEIYKRDMDLGFVTFETNGTQKLSEDLINTLNDYKDFLEVTFSISSKLSSSGEKWKEAIRPDNVSTYFAITNSKHYFKWVCTSPDDLQDVQKAEQEYKQAGIKIPIYLMPCGGTEKLYLKNQHWLAKICLANGYRYSQRLHLNLFGKIGRAHV